MAAGTPKHAAGASGGGAAGEALKELATAVGSGPLAELAKTALGELAPLIADGLSNLPFGAGTAFNVIRVFFDRAQQMKVNDKCFLQLGKLVRNMSTLLSKTVTNQKNHADKLGQELFDKGTMSQLEEVRGLVSNMLCVSHLLLPCT